MLRDMTVDVTAQTVQPTPTAVVTAVVTWAEFPKMWRPMLDQVWRFLRDDAPAGLYNHGHNIMLYMDDVPSVEVGVQVRDSFAPAGRVVASTLPGGLVATRDPYWPYRGDRRYSSGGARVERGERLPAGWPLLGDLRRS